ncbi:MAG TPA: CHRD domain-containing protein [Sandaracinaceae bacterium]
MPDHRLLSCVTILFLSLSLVACDDDDEDLDAGRRDAGMRDAGVRDAGPRDAGPRDAGRRDGGTDAGAEFSATVTLTTEAEVPVCDAAADEAMGTATITIDAANTRIDVEVTYTGLSGPATAAHIHFGGPDEAGPIVLDLGPDVSSPIERSFTADDYPSPPPEDAPATFAAFIEAMRAGETYVNVHTADCPQGEIRAQIVD